MNNKMPTTIGKFVWHDLRTDDPERAQAFYSELFGWTFRGDAQYSHVHNAGRDQGGVVVIEPGTEAGSHWTGYVSVGDVDVIVARAEVLGAKRLAPVVDVPDVGRFTVLADPQGARFSPFEYSVVEKTPPRTGKTPHGDLSWDELLTEDPASACAFYGELLTWKQTKLDMGPMGSYWNQKTATQDVCGIMKLSRGLPQRSSWIPYVAVDAVDATAKLVPKLGGIIQSPPTDIPSIGRFAMLADPTGATIAIYKKF